MAKKSPIHTPAGLLLRAFVLVLVTWGAIFWIIAITGSSGKRWAGSPPLQAHAQLKSIQRRLSSQAAEKMGKIFPEGRLFTYSFYGFSLLNMATALPDNHEFRQAAVRELERIIPIVERLATEPPYDICNNMTPSGGAIAGGHTNLLRAGYALLGGRSGKIIRDFHLVSAASYKEFQRSKTGIIESYPEESWPVDNCCILESLRLHDCLYETNYSAAAKKWSKSLRSHRDPETGMIASQIALNGLVLDGPRGCALSWMLAFLPPLDPELARDQYARYRKDWFVPLWGFVGIREWPRGQERLMDADSGPVLLGIGAAASGLGLAAAKANGDWQTLTGLLRGLELFGFPARTFQGEKRYLAQMILLADILALWGKTFRPWDGPFMNRDMKRWPPIPAPGLWKTLLCILAVLSLPIFLLARETFRTGRCLLEEKRWRRLRDWSLAAKAFLSAQTIVLLVWFLIPGFGWFFAFLIMALLETVERRMAAATNAP